MRNIHHETIKLNDFQPIEYGQKTYDIREWKGYQIGDIVQYSILGSTGDFVAIDYAIYEITYISKKHDGLKDGYCILALHKLDSRSIIDEAEDDK